MNAPAYTLNKEYAIEGDGSGSNRITESGAYTGTITTAESVSATTGTIGIEIHFETSDGQKAYFTLWTHKASGQEVYGLKQLNALMTTLQQKQLTPTRGNINKYNFDSKQEEQVQATVYPELHKPAGLVLQMEEYINNNGDKKQRMNFFAAFNPQTRQTAAEVMNKTTPATNVDNILQHLKDKLLPEGATNAGYSAQTAAPVNDLDDDIPF